MDNRFIESLYRGKGYYAWSSGRDLHGREHHWGLGSTVFVVKLYALLEVEPPNKQYILQFIHSFKQDGLYYDPLIHKKAWFRRRFRGNTKLAETHQTVAAIESLGGASGIREITEQDYKDVSHSGGSTNKEELFFRLCKGFMGSNEHLNFRKNCYYKNPWHFGSIINHYVFLESRQGDKWFPALNDINLCYSVERHTSNNIINGAMKVLMAYNMTDNKIEDNNHVMGRNYSGSLFGLWYLLSTAMLAKNNSLERPRLFNLKLNHACDILNSVYVVHTLWKHSPRSKEELTEYVAKIREEINKYRFDGGGYGFFKDKRPRRYYGVTITRPFKGADIHGTYLLTWASKLVDEIERFEYRETKFSKYQKYGPYHWIGLGL